MTDRRKRWGVAGAVTLMGAVFLSVTLFDIYADVTIQGEPVSLTLLENVLPALVNLGIIWYGVRFMQDGPLGAYVERVSRRVAVTVIAILGITAWIYYFQIQQGRIKPAILGTNIIAMSTFVGLFIGVQDAEREHRERQLELERNRFASLFENVPNPIVGVRVREDSAVVEAVNPAFEEVFGYKEGELLGESLSEHILPPDADADVMPDDSETWGEEEVSLETRHGRREFLRMTAPVADDNFEETTYVIYIDITDQKQRQERLRVLSRTLRHDIRNKMTVVKGNAEMLAEEVDDPELRELAEGITEAARDLLSVSEQSRHISETVSGATDTRPVNLAAITRKAVTAARERHDDATFTVDLPEVLTVQGSAALEEAVENVVENAVEHNDRAPRVEVTSRTTFDGDYVELLVADNGPGIPEPEREVIAGDRSPDQLEHASGLGLWLVAWVLTNHGGQLSFEPNSPEGTVAVLRLPTP